MERQSGDARKLALVIRVKSPFSRVRLQRSAHLRGEHAVPKPQNVRARRTRDDGRAASGAAHAHLRGEHARPEAAERESSPKA